MGVTYKVVGIFPAIVINKGEVVSLQAEEDMYIQGAGEEEAIKEFRDLGPIRTVDNGPWVHPKNAIAYIVTEV